MRELGHKDGGSEMPSSGLGRVRRALARFAEPAEQVLWVDSLEMEHLGMESANPSFMGPGEFSGTDASDASDLALPMARDSQEPA